MLGQPNSYSCEGHTSLSSSLSTKVPICQNLDHLLLSNVASFASLPVNILSRKMVSQISSISSSMANFSISKSSPTACRQFQLLNLFLKSCSIWRLRVKISSQRGSIIKFSAWDSSWLVMDGGREQWKGNNRDWKSLMDEKGSKYYQKSKKMSI